MNIVILKGNLARDPEIRTTNSGTTIARMSLAVNRISKDKGVDFINLIAFNKTAEFVGKYLSKGRQILIEGRIQTGSYTTDSGEKRYTTDIITDRIEFCGTKGDEKKEEETTTEVPF